MELQWILFIFIVVAFAYFIWSRKRSPKYPWMGYGVLSTPGIPPPTGNYTVGCVDLVDRRTKEDNSPLIRLFYPTNAGAATRYPYAKSVPNSRYLQSILEMVGYRFPGLLAKVMYCLIGECMWGVYNPLLNTSTYSSSP